MNGHRILTLHVRITSSYLEQVSLACHLTSPDVPRIRAMLERNFGHALKRRMTRRNGGRPPTSSR